jgi:hypothetical protein
LKSQNYKNVSDLSIGFTGITSEFYLYLLRVSGQREFFRISFPAPSVPPNVLGRAAEISDLLKPRNSIFENSSILVCPTRKKAGMERPKSFWSSFWFRSGFHFSGVSVIDCVFDRMSLSGWTPF